jgi:hypothetical protein
VSALAFSPDGLKLAAGDVSTLLYLFIFLFGLWAQLLSPLVNIFLTPLCNVYVVRPLTLATFLSLSNQKKKVQWKSHPLRRHEARSDHLPLGLPFGARKLVELDRGLATLRLWCARYARIRLERPETPQEHSDQERSGWGCQCRPLVVRWRQGQWQWQLQVSGDGRGRSNQGVAGQVPRVRRSMYSTLLYIGVDQPAAVRCDRMSVEKALPSGAVPS